MKKFYKIFIESATKCQLIEKGQMLSTLKLIIGLVNKSNGIIIERTDGQASTKDKMNSQWKFLEKTFEKQIDELCEKDVIKDKEDFENNLQFEISSMKKIFVKRLANEKDLHDYDKAMLESSCNIVLERLKDEYKEKLKKKKNEIKSIFFDEIISPLKECLKKERFLYDKDLGPKLIDLKANTKKRLEKCFRSKILNDVDLDKTINRYFYNLIIFNDAVSNSFVNGVTIIASVPLFTIGLVAAPFVAVGAMVADSILAGSVSVLCTSTSIGASFHLSNFRKGLRFHVAKPIKYALTEQEKKNRDYIITFFCNLTYNITYYILGLKVKLFDITQESYITKICKYCLDEIKKYAKKIGYEETANNLENLFEQCVKQLEFDVINYLKSRKTFRIENWLEIIKNIILELNDCLFFKRGSKH